MAALLRKLLDGYVRRETAEYSLLEAFLLAVAVVHTPKESIALDRYDYLLEKATAANTILRHATTRREDVHTIFQCLMCTTAILIATAAIDHTYKVVATRYPIDIPISIEGYVLEGGACNRLVVYHSPSCLIVLHHKGNHYAHAGKTAT